MGLMTDLEPPSQRPEVLALADWPRLSNAIWDAGRVVTALTAKRFQVMLCHNSPVAPTWYKGLKPTNLRANKNFMTGQSHCEDALCRVGIPLGKWFQLELQRQAKRDKRPAPRLLCTDLTVACEMIARSKP